MSAYSYLCGQSDEDLSRRLEYLHGEIAFLRGKHDGTEGDRAWRKRAIAESAEEVTAIECERRRRAALAEFAKRRQAEFTRVMNKCALQLAYLASLRPYLASLRREVNTRNRDSDDKLEELSKQVDELRRQFMPHAPSKAKGTNLAKIDDTGGDSDAIDQARAHADALDERARRALVMNGQRHVS